MWDTPDARLSPVEMFLTNYLVELLLMRDSRTLRRPGPCCTKGSRAPVGPAGPVLTELDARGTSSDTYPEAVACTRHGDVELAAKPLPPLSLAIIGRWFGVTDVVGPDVG